jgi:hypothetical protein
VAVLSDGGAVYSYDIDNVGFWQILLKNSSHRLSQRDSVALVPSSGGLGNDGRAVDDAGQPVLRVSP